ncbi:MAG: hypothetical protein QXN59_02330 [Candidatus Micrarchaeaceae archaeon]
MAQQLASRDACDVRLIRREQLILVEVGLDKIDSASSFVDYMCESYGFSKSSVWYNLKSLKKKGVLDFASRDEPGKPLALTKEGMGQFMMLKDKKNALMSTFGEPAIAMMAAKAGIAQRDIRGAIVDGMGVG